MVFDFQINFDKQRKLQRKNSPWGLFRNVKFGIFFSNHALIVRRYYNQYGFMTHHWKANVSRTSWKSPPVSCIWYQAPEKLPFCSPPWNDQHTQSPLRACLATILKFFSQILMKHLGGGLAPTWMGVLMRHPKAKEQSVWRKVSIYKLRPDFLF